MPDPESNENMPWTHRNNFSIKLPSGHRLNTFSRPLLMGILNVTPDSFSDGGDFLQVEDAVAHARRMVFEGADIIDIGGESTRPGSRPVDQNREKERVLTVIRQIRAECDIPVSIDTRKAQVAAEAIEAGAEIINDISALCFDPEMAGVAASSNAAVCLMHMQGKPQTMQKSPTYDDVVSDIKLWIQKRIDFATNAGINEDRIFLDPGFGFGKTAHHNLEILRRFSEFNTLGCPLLMGTSRKSTIGEVLDKPVCERLWGSLATAACLVLAGVHVLRVHDIAATLDAVKMSEAILRGREWKQ